MRILYITPRFPYPPLKGDQAVAYHRLRMLGLSNEITLLSLYEKEEELTGLKYLTPYCLAIHVVRHQKYQSILNILLKAPFSNLPLQVLYYQSSNFKKSLEALLQENQYDLIHAFMLRIADYLDQVQLPKILDLNDSMQLNLKNRLALEPWYKRWIWREELRRITNYEQGVGSKFDHMIVVAEKDKSLILSNNLSVIPLGVDIDHFAPIESIQPQYTLIFSGNMSYAPNIHAIQWFVQCCFLKIIKEVNNVSLVIAGSSPVPEVLALEQYPGVQVKGFVESMSQTLNQAYIAIAPMQSGSGMQFKILEAMACGLPVITTTLGLGNIKAQNGHEIVVADTPECFAQNVIDMVRNPVFAKVLGQRARDYVVKNHSWEHANHIVETLYHKYT